MQISRLSRGHHATEEATPRPDVFTLGHKGQRRELFLLLTNAGTANWSDPSGVATFATMWNELRRALELDADEERKHYFPLLAGNAPKLFEQANAQHDKLALEITNLDSTVADAARTPTSEVGLEVYRQLSAFIASYLLHMLVEETEVMPAIWQHCDDTAIHHAIALARADQSVAARLQRRHMMLPAVSPAERETFEAPHEARRGLG